MIANLSSNKNLRIKIVELKNIWSKSLGVIPLNKDLGVFMKTHFGIHTFFVAKPLDIVILDKNRKVKRLEKKLKPGKLFFWNPIFNSVLELPQGSIDKLEIKKGDIIRIEL